jgi:hypothetical protein
MMRIIIWFGIGIMAGASISLTISQFLMKATLTPNDIMGYALLSLCCVWQSCAYCSGLNDEEYS